MPASYSSSRSRVLYEYCIPPHSEQHMCCSPESASSRTKPELIAPQSATQPTGVAAHTDLLMLILCRRGSCPADLSRSVLFLRDHPAGRRDCQVTTNFPWILDPKPVWMSRLVCSRIYSLSSNELRTADCNCCSPQYPVPSNQPQQCRRWKNSGRGINK